jgi:hypothetical protein
MCSAKTGSLRLLNIQQEKYSTYQCLVFSKHVKHTPSHYTVTQETLVCTEKLLYYKTDTFAYILRNLQMLNVTFWQWSYTVQTPSVKTYITFY